MSLSIDASQSIWRTTLSNTVTNSDLLKLARCIDVLNRETPVGPKGLVDLREISDVDIDLATLKQVKQEMDRHIVRSESKTGFIARSPMQYGIARAIQMLLYDQPIEMQVFEDNDEALKWVQY
jgi:hypothetical protein